MRRFLRRLPQNLERALFFPQNAQTYAELGGALFLQNLHDAGLNSHPMATGMSQLRGHW